MSPDTTPSSLATFRAWSRAEGICLVSYLLLWLSEDYNMPTSWQRCREPLRLGSTIHLYRTREVAVMDATASCRCVLPNHRVVHIQTRGQRTRSSLSSGRALAEPMDGYSTSLVGTDIRPRLTRVLAQLRGLLSQLMPATLLLRNSRRKSSRQRHGGRSSRSYCNVPQVDDRTAW